MQKKKNFKIFVDTETTGFPEQGGWIGNDLVSWSGIITDRDLNIIKKDTFFSRPTNSHTWSEEAEKIHGISYYEAMNFPTQRQTMISIMNFLKENVNDLEWIEHSLNWIDWLFTFGLFMKQGYSEKFRMALNPNYRFSTIRMARQKGFKKNKLNEWADRLGIKLDHHNSESDAIACLNVYKYLNEYQTDQEGFFGLMEE